MEESLFVEVGGETKWQRTVLFVGRTKIIHLLNLYPLCLSVSGGGRTRIDLCKECENYISFARLGSLHHYTRRTIHDHMMSIGNRYKSTLKIHDHPGMMSMGNTYKFGAGPLMSATMRSEAGSTHHLQQRNMLSQVTDDMQQQLHLTETQLRNTFSRLDIETQQKLEAENLVSALESEVRELEQTFKRAASSSRGGALSRGLDEEVSDGDEDDSLSVGSADTERQRQRIIRADERSEKTGARSSRSARSRKDAGANGKFVPGSSGLLDIEGEKLLEQFVLHHRSSSGALLEDGAGPQYGGEYDPGGGYFGERLACVNCRALVERNEKHEQTITRLRVIINEMSMRLVRMKGVMQSDDVSIPEETQTQIFRKSGLEEFLKKNPRNVFNRLYNDALQRLRRLEDAAEQGEQHVLRIITTEDIPEALKQKLCYKGGQIVGRKWDGTMSTFFRGGSTSIRAPGSTIHGSTIHGSTTSGGGATVSTLMGGALAGGPPPVEHEQRGASSSLETTFLTEGGAGRLEEFGETSCTESALVGGVGAAGGPILAEPSSSSLLHMSGRHQAPFSTRGRGPTKSVNPTFFVIRDEDHPSTPQRRGGGQRGSGEKPRSLTSTLSSSSPLKSSPGKCSTSPTNMWSG